MRLTSDARPTSRPSLRERIGRTRPLWIGAASACLLLWVAALNGYPTMFSDSGGYLWTGMFFVPLPPFRAPGYSIFTRYASWGVSTWFVIAMQAVIVVYVLFETCDYLADGERAFRDRLLIAVVCGITVLTSLPWFVSLLMPDAFAGVLFLSAFLLAFARGLGWLRRSVLAMILALAVSTHASFLPIALIFALGTILWRLAGRGPLDVPAVRSIAVWLLVPILMAGIGTACLNRKMGLGFRYSASGDTFLLARLFSDGLAGDFLQKTCSKEPFISCRYLADLPHTQEEFLFRHPLMQDLAGHEEEISAIVRGTLRAHPIEFAKSSIRDTFLQLAAVRTGDEIRSYGARDWNAGVMQEMFPNEFAVFSHSRQARGLLASVADAASRIHVIVFWLGAVTCLFFAQNGGFRRMNALFYSAVLFLVLNAAICATVAGVFDRYQSRVAWLIPFCLTAYAYGWAKEPQTCAVDSVRLTVSPSSDSGQSAADAEIIS